jgi:urea transporter
MNNYELILTGLAVAAIISAVYYYNKLNSLREMLYNYTAILIGIAAQTTVVKRQGDTVTFTNETEEGTHEVCIQIREG